VKSVADEKRHLRLAFGSRSAVRGADTLAMGTDDNGRGQYSLREAGGIPFPTAGVAASRAMRAIVMPNAVSLRTSSARISAAKRCPSSLGMADTWTVVFFHNRTVRLPICRSRGFVQMFQEGN
jgi:hypothetical protein